MSTIKWFCSVLLILAMLTACGEAEVTKSDDLPLISGNELPQNLLSESVVVLNFWAVWCAPCRKEIPELNQLHEEGVVQVLGIDFDQQKDQGLTTAIAAMGIQFPVLASADLPYLEFEWPQVLPTTLIIAEDKIVETLLGPQTYSSLTEAVSRAQSPDKH